MSYGHLRILIIIVVCVDKTYRMRFKMLERYATFKQRPSTMSHYKTETEKKLSV